MVRLRLARATAGERNYVVLERLQKVMARAGIASRRECQEIIKNGRVRVDGDVVHDTGFKVDPDVSEIRIDNRVLVIPKLVYLVMNKPKNVVTTMDDPQRRRTVADLLPALDHVVKPAGRLDFATEGLLLFTNDGELILRLTHPRYGIWKTYIAKVRGPLTKRQIERLSKGVHIEGRKTSPAKVELISSDAKSGRSTVKIEIHEGRKHQVRLMFEAVGSMVYELERTKMGPITLGKLRSGQSRMLSKVEVDKLKAAVKL